MADNLSYYAQVPHESGSKVFATELDMIKKKQLRDWVAEVLDSDLIPEYFWWAPCSSSGKFHPKMNQGPCGIVRHVRSTVWWAKELCVVYGVCKYLDIVVAACILHDGCKFGPDYDGTSDHKKFGWTESHGYKFAEELTKRYPKTNLDQKRTIAAIASHMGQWTSDDKYKSSNYTNQITRCIARLVHMADFCSSRKIDVLQQYTTEAEQLMESSNAYREA